MHLKRLFILLCLSHAFSIYSQTPWNDCCRGYENGFKKGYSYPDLYLSNTVASPACNCTGILGDLTYEAGYIKGFEEGKIKKRAFLDNNNKSQNDVEQNKVRNKFNEYIPAVPFIDLEKTIHLINLKNQSTAKQINQYLKYRDLRQLDLIRQCDIDYYIQEKNKLDEGTL